MGPRMGLGMAAVGLALVAGAGVGGAAPTALSPAEPPGHRITLTDAAGAPLALYYEEHGEGAPVLLLHGLGESTFTWHEIAPELAKGHRVIALDLKGFGRSDKPKDHAYAADDQAALVARFIAAKKLDAVTIIGHSFGGTVALKTALADGVAETRRIRRIAVIGAPALPRATAPHLDLVRIPALPDVLASALPPEWIARLLLSEAMGGAKEVSEATVQGYAAPYRDPEAMHPFLATARAIVKEKDEKIVVRRLRQIRVPVLVVWCRKDPIVPLRSGRKLAATLRTSRLRIIDGCHHLPQHERPRQLLSELQRFLAS